MQREKPFDLKAAKEGAEILCDGKPCEFIAHVPDNDPEWRVVVAREGRLATCTEDGRGWVDGRTRLTMAPRRVRIVGYRDYYAQLNSSVRRCKCDEDATPSMIAAIEKSEGFLRWVHDTWQYDEVVI
jgi:hypothetical protein